jgi:hypothetical protein
MTDSHLFILRLMAEQRQRLLHNYDAVDHTGDAGSAALRQHLAQAVKRTSAQVAGAEARRDAREPGGALPVSPSQRETPDPIGPDT